MDQLNNLQCEYLLKYSDLVVSEEIDHKPSCYLFSGREQDDLFSILKRKDLIDYDTQLKII